MSTPKNVKQETHFARRDAVLNALDFESETARLEVLASVKIQQEMKKRKISRKELARRIGMSDKQIVAIFDGDIQMTFELLARLGLGLGVHWDFGKL